MMTSDKAYLSHTAAAKQWELIGIKRHHGVNLPLFSLWSEQSCGIGEYPDLLPLLPWCQEIGMDVIQLLPLNDNGPDASPYSAISAFALNPLHLGISTLPGVTEDPLLMKQIETLRQLNHQKRVNYQAVTSGKGHFLLDYYHRFGAEFVKTRDFQEFIQKQPWLEGYALFKTLKMQNRWYSWEFWNPKVRNISLETRQGLLQENRRSIDYHIFVQYLCFQQLEKVKQEAEKHGVFIKGDIPILINRESADVWLNRGLFLMNYSAGAPPDMYNKEGQKWGFPLYNWETIKKEHYRWWIDRLDTAARFYHLYRLDHIVGFFRIWGIPLDEPAKMGTFIPENQTQWIPQGKHTMEIMLKNCMMLPIGEDLGTVPPEVRACLHSLGICGTKVMRWERNWNTDRSFIKPQNYPFDSMTTLSTHDSETLLQWWKKCPEEAKDYAHSLGWEYNAVLSHEHHLNILKDSHDSKSLFHINLLQEYLALIPGMTWPNLEEERINIPGIISDKNWTYRFRPQLEEIIQSEPLKNLIKNILHKS